MAEQEKLEELLDGLEAISTLLGGTTATRFDVKCAAAEAERLCDLVRALPRPQAGAVGELLALAEKEISRLLMELGHEPADSHILQRFRDIPSPAPDGEVEELRRLLEEARPHLDALQATDDAPEYKTLYRKVCAALDRKDGEE